MSLRTRLRGGLAAALCLTALLAAAACSQDPNTEAGGGDAAEALGSLVISVAGPEGASGDVGAKVYAGDVAEELADGAELDPVAEAAVPIGGEARAEGLAAGEVTVVIEASDRLEATGPEAVEISAGGEARVSFELKAVPDGGAAGDDAAASPAEPGPSGDAAASADGPGSRASAAQQGSPQGGAPAGCAHSWQPVTEQRWVPNVVTVVDSEAWDEPVYDGRIVCSHGSVFSSSQEYREHVHALGVPDSYSIQNVQVGSIYHPAVTHTEDRGWYETVTVGSRCSKCGAQG